MKSFAAISLVLISLLLSCDTWRDGLFLREIPNQIQFEQKLSAYRLFAGEMYQLQPAEGVFPYDLATPLFTDYAEKQRLIKLPQGTSMSAGSSQLLDFSDGTILVKTFYYKDSNNGNTGNRTILETRLLILEAGSWNVGVYKWNEDQSEAYLLEKGYSVQVPYENTTGKSITINYQIPSNIECTTCHQSAGIIQPIGPKLGNLNVSTNSTPANISQLDYWQSLGLLNLKQGININYLPDWTDASISPELRARAYLEVNCAHCHNPDGVASAWRLNLDYETPFAKTGIQQMKHEIPARMQSSRADEKMPKIGTTLIHEEGLELVKEYLDNL